MLVKLIEMFVVKPEVDVVFDKGRCSFCCFEKERVSSFNRTNIYFIRARCFNECVE